MTYTSVFCIADSHPQADQIVERLRAAKFSHRDISVLLADHGFTHWNHGPGPADGEGDEESGGWRWVAGIGALPIPEVGAFMAAGPLIAAMCGAPGAKSAAGVVGGLRAMGIPEAQAQRFEGRIRDGHILISAHTGNPRQVTQAKGIFSHAGAQDLCCAGAAAAPGSHNGAGCATPTALAAH